MSEEPVSVDFAVSLAGMVRQLLDQDSVQTTLERIAAQAVSSVDGCEEASVMVLQANRRLETVAATSELGRESDRVQTELREGPCFDAIDQKQEIYRVADMGGGGDRWPRYAPRARELGIGSMLGFLLFTTRETLGALNLYSSQPEVFTERSEQVGWVFAAHAAVAFASARNDAQLHEAIATRQGIGEAMGIVMERYKVSEDRAFEMLKKISQDRNLKLRDLARRLVESGEISETDGG